MMRPVLLSTPHQVTSVPVGPAFRSHSMARPPLAPPAAPLAAHRRAAPLCRGTIDPEVLTDRSTPISELQRMLQEAIEGEDYTVAAQLRDEIERRRFDNRLAVEEANDAFYEAFRTGNLSGMSAIWGEGEHVQCVHPGAAVIAGRDAVLESWKAVLGSGRMAISLQDVRIFATESEGFVTCVEVLEANDSRGRVVATNVFEKQGKGWKLVHHHGSRLASFF